MKPYYERGGVTIFHGDCREVLPQLRHVADLLITDPPYAAAAATITTGFAREKWGGNWGDMSLVTLMATSILDLDTMKRGHQVVWFCDHLSYAALLPVFFRRYELVQNVVWDKDMLGVGAHYRKQTELVIYARDRGAPDAARTDLRDIKRVRPVYADKEHPAAKPLPLLASFMGDLVWECAIDPFMGSGTALVAARDLGRRAIGIEIEERYCEIAARRLGQDVFAFGEDPAA